MLESGNAVSKVVTAKSRLDFLPIGSRQVDFDVRNGCIRQIRTFDSMPLVASLFLDSV